MGGEGIEMEESGEFGTKGKIDDGAEKEEEVKAKSSAAEGEEDERGIEG